MAADPIAEDLRPRWRQRRIGRAVRLGVVLVLTTLVVLLATPLLDRPVPSHPAPADSYAAALGLADRLRAADGPEVDPVCRSRVLDQGRRTRVAVVLLHGYTNCPQQWVRIATAYAEQGVSVVVPRLPGHGYADRQTRALGDLTPAALAAAADQALDIATGLGEEVHVVGTSAGGALAMWLADRRVEVDRLTLVSPLAAPQPVPAFLVGPLTRAVRLAPDGYRWWDGAQRERLATPPHAYPGFSTRGLGAFLEVARSLDGGDPSRPLRRMTLVLNESDPAVSNPAARRAVGPLTRTAEQRVDHEFAKSLGVGHDLIDPQGENAARIGEIYATLGPLLDLPDLSG